MASKSNSDNTPDQVRDYNTLPDPWELVDRIEALESKLDDWHGKIVSVGAERNRAVAQMRTLKFWKEMPDNLYALILVGFIISMGLSIFFVVYVCLRK